MCRQIADKTPAVLSGTVPSPCPSQLPLQPFKLMRVAVIFPSSLVSLWHRAFSVFLPTLPHSLVCLTISVTSGPRQLSVIHSRLIFLLFKKLYFSHPSSSHLCILASCWPFMWKLMHSLDNRQPTGVGSDSVIFTFHFFFFVPQTLVTFFSILLVKNISLLTLWKSFTFGSLTSQSSKSSNNNQIFVTPTLTALKQGEHASYHALL